jgi:glutaminyl-tRNA synthetase
MENPPKKFFRLSPGAEVRLRYAYFVKCTGVEKDPATGQVTVIHCTYDPASRGGNSPDGRKVKSTIHWVSAPHAFRAEVRLYDRLFNVPDPDDVPEGQDFKIHLNPDSLKIINAWCEPYLAAAKAYDRFQFERVGYFCVDPDSQPGKDCFQPYVTLKDTWAKIQARGNQTKLNDGYAPDLMTERQKIRGCTISRASPKYQSPDFFIPS